MKTVNDINLLREKAKQSLASCETKVYVHMGTCGIASGAQEILAALQGELKANGLAADVIIVKTGCAGICSQEPMITVAIPSTEPIMYKKLTPAKVAEIVKEHIVDGKPVAKYAYARGMEYQIKERVRNNGQIDGEKVVDATIPAIEDVPFFHHQETRVLHNRGLIDPTKINDYLACDGYEGAIKALTEMTSDEIVKEVTDSGLRGRGGAGFPTGRKWGFAAKEVGDVKYMLCNADEGDPGAYMDRTVMESDPHSIIEGMIIGAKAIGAHQGYIYCRAEYPLAIETLNKAITQARALNLLGENILDTGFDFDIEIYEGAGAFVCGEETALMRSIEGKRGNPITKPPFPAKQGLWKKPSVLNNVETLANIGAIISKGSKWFREVGTEKSSGTKIFSITGDIENVGCVEVPIGTSLDVIVNKIGVVQKNKNFKAVQLGGPSGGCIPKQHLDVALDYETLQEYGSIMGSGGLIVMSDDKSAVDIAKFFIEFCKEEACGKCVPGREGTKHMLEILNKISSGKGTEEDIAKLEKLSGMMQNMCLCALCKTSVNPVLSTLRYFRDEYETAVNKKQ